MNAIEPSPQMLRLCAACAPFMPNAQAETADQFQARAYHDFDSFKRASMEYDDTMRGRLPCTARGFRKGNFITGQRGTRRTAAKDVRP